jgi:metal transporter CNNM
MFFATRYAIARADWPIFVLELIGEEIYDEFDQQGAHGDPYKVPPVPEEKHRDPAPSSAETSMPKSTPTLPVHMPTALRGLGGFGFLKARSTPPVPGEETDLHVEAHTPGAVYDPEDDKSRDLSNSNIPRTQSAANIEMPDPVVGANLQAPTVIVQNDNLSSPAVPSETTSVLLPPGVGAEGKTKSSPLSASSRAAAPAPPLETALVERKRRLVGTLSRPTSPVGSTVNLAATGAPAAPAIASARSGHMKGSRFKSSPLGTGEGAGVEKINEGAHEVEEKEVKEGDEQGRILG